MSSTDLHPSEKLVIVNSVDQNLDSPALSKQDHRIHGDGNKDSQEPVGYITPLEDPFLKAHRYSAKHNILDLFQTITAGIAYHRPEKPINFMIEELKKLQEMERKRKGLIENGDKKDTNES